MSEIKVGEYVRTNEGYIGKLIQIIPNVLNYYVIDTKIKVRNDGMPETYLYSRDGYGFKHSPNIIDLIRVGDFVNGKRVIGVSNITGWVDTIEDVIYKDMIKSVVTKERFAESEYRIK